MRKISKCATCHKKPNLIRKWLLMHAKMTQTKHAIYYVFWFTCPCCDQKYFAQSINPNRISNKDRRIQANEMIRIWNTSVNNNKMRAKES